MTTQPPAAGPAPAAPAGPPKPPSSGTVSLIFGLLLCLIALYPSIRFLFVFAYALVSGDAYTFGVATGTLIGVAIFLVPGILLLRKSNRARRANRAAIDGYIYELEHEYDDDEEIPLAAQVPTVPTTPAGSSTPSAPPVPPLTPPA